MTKKVIYTCLTGDYDEIKEPRYIMEGWDYIVFSNDLNISNDSIWKRRPIALNINNNQATSRFPKLNPHLVLNNYDISIFIDSNICILDNKLERRVNELINLNVKLSIAKHPERSCIYKEADICLKEGLDKKKHINRHLKYLRSTGFPENFGLFENNIIFRVHNDPEIIKLDNAWWELFSLFSKRDQLSLAYLLWKQQQVCFPLFEDGFNVRNSESFLYSYHKKSNIPLLKRIKKKLAKIIRKLR